MARDPDPAGAGPRQEGGMEVPVPGLTGKLLFHLLPIRRRIILGNLRRAFGGKIPQEGLVRLAQAFYGHAALSLLECLWLPWLPEKRRRDLVRVENTEAVLEAAARGKGVLILTGHFGNWEIAPVLGMAGFPQYRGRFHILRRPIRLRWIEGFATRRFERAGIHVIPKAGSLPVILDRLAAGDAVVFILDQHASRKDGVRTTFFGQPVSTFRSLAVIALATGAPVVPAASWRDESGRHVLRFETALPLLEKDDANEAIRANTQAYNDALEKLLQRHPEQWFWLHRRWREPAGQW